MSEPTQQERTGAFSSSDDALEAGLAAGFAGPPSSVLQAPSAVVPGNAASMAGKLR